MNKLSSVQDVDRCVRCNHERKCSDNLEGKCRYERVIEDIASSVCGCKCAFPSPSVPPCRHGRNANEYCFDCVRERHNDDMSDGRFDDDELYARVHQPPEQNLEDKNSFSPKPKAPSHSSVVVPESVSLTLAEIRKDLKRGARPWYNTDIRALLSIIDSLQRGDGFVSTTEESPGPASPSESESVHQPDVQKAAELRKALQAAFDFYMDMPRACGDFTCACGDVKYCGICAIRESTRAVLAASPVHPEVSKEQDNAKS